MVFICVLKVVTFQLVLLSNVDHSFILFNYGNIAETRQQWLVSLKVLLQFKRESVCKLSVYISFFMQAHYGTVDSAHSYTCSLLKASELSFNSNVNINGRWVFQVYNGNVIYFHSFFTIFLYGPCTVFILLSLHSIYFVLIFLVMLIPIQ